MTWLLSASIRITWNVDGKWSNSIIIHMEILVPRTTLASESILWKIRGWGKVDILDALAAPFFVYFLSMHVQQAMVCWCGRRNVSAGDYLLYLVLKNVSWLKFFIVYYIPTLATLFLTAWIFILCSFNFRLQQNNNSRFDLVSSFQV